MFRNQPLIESLNRTVDDLESIVKHLATVMTTPREKRSMFHSEIDVVKLVELFRLKELEWQNGIKFAKEHAERQKVLDQLESELRRRNEAVTSVTKCFKECEELLINAIYQANQKVKAIHESNRRKVSPDELIKYAHKISATNAVAAPLNWQQGDLQRPFPVEMEMMQGWMKRQQDSIMSSGDMPRDSSLQQTSVFESPQHSSINTDSGSNVALMAQDFVPHNQQGLVNAPPIITAVSSSPQTSSFSSSDRPISALPDEWPSPLTTMRFTGGPSGGNLQQTQQLFKGSSPHVKQQQQQPYFSPGKLPMIGSVAQSPKATATQRTPTTPLVAALVKKEQQSSQDLMEVATMSSDSSSSSDSDSQ